MKKGIFIGRTTMDLVYYRHGLPAENKKGSTTDYTTCVGGNACNAAVTYALLGGRAVLITAIGNSAVGKSLKTELQEEHHIEVLDLLEEQDILPFISAILVNVENESRTIWGGHQPPLDFTGLPLEEIIRGAGFILTDNQFPQIAAALLRRAKDGYIPSVFDAERWGEETEMLLNAASEVIASADCLPPDGRNLFDVMREKQVLLRAVTDGGNPILWETGDRKGSILPMQVKTVDTLGAGDILHGAYCYFRFNQELPFEKALEKASQVSSFSVAYRGPRQGVLEYMAKDKV